MDTDEIVLKIYPMNIKETDKTEEKKELKRRSDLMDQEVEGIKRRREDEEKKYIEMKDLKEKKKIESEDVAREELRKSKEEEKKQKNKQITKNKGNKEE